MRHLHAPARKLAAAVAVVATVLATLIAPSAMPAAVAAGSSQSPAGGSPGYWLVGNNGEVFQLGTTNYGDLRGRRLNRPVVGGAPADDGLGYWLVASDGGIFSFGDASFHGSTGGITLNKPVVGMAADPVTGGYWLVASDGGVFAFDATFFGSTGRIALAKPVVGMAPTPSGHGYWLVASDGGVFAFGDAQYFGSTGGIRLAKPVVGMAATADGKGYWLVASDGGIFAFGDARFHGSTGSIRLDAPVVAMSATPSGGGYWLAASDGGVFSFGDAPFIGAAGTNGAPPIVGIMATAHGYPFPPGATGYDVSQYQCPYYSGHVSGLPATHPAVAVVQVSGGAINQAQPAQCYPAEAQWAGRNLSDYIFMNPLPSPAPKESLTGPAGNCAPGNVSCESFNLGFHWASYWVAYAHADDTQPTLWWLDVEFSGGWDRSSTAQPSNVRVIEGAVAGLKSSGVTPGIYSTNLQWDDITGDQASFPNIALWVPGAENVNSGSFSATSFCSIPPQPVKQGDPVSDYAPFAGGTTVLVQYGYGNVPAHTYDEDYACK
jgi:hypothetical protein